MIRAIARHERSSQLRAVQTWLIAALLAAWFGFLFLQQLENWVGIQAQLALTDNPPGLTGFLAARFLAPLALLFGIVAPLFAMRAISDELRMGTAALWQSSPVSDTAFVLGKFWGALSIPLALTLLSATMVAAMTAFVRVDLGALATAALGLSLACAAFSAIGLYCSSLTRHPLVAVLAALAFILMLWLIGNSASDVLPDRVSRVFAAVGLDARLGGFFQGYLRSGDLAYLVLLTLTFLALCVIRIDGLRRADNRLPTILSLLVVAIAIALGWLATRFDHAVDVTANARHSLSPSSIAAAEALEPPVELLAVLRPDPAQRQTLDALVDRFREFKPDITVEYINPDTDPARARSVNAAPGGELILSAGAREQRLQLLSERAFASALRRLGQDEQRNILFVSGHGERRPGGDNPDDWGDLAARLASGGLIARETSLIAEPRIAATTDVLVIAAPRSAYFPGELASVIAHFRAGGNLLWLTETETGSETGPELDALALELGVETLKGTVIDTSSQQVLANTDADGSSAADFVVLDRFPAHPITEALASALLIPEARALGAVPLAGQTLKPLLQTPESSWTETGALEGAVRFSAEDGEVAGPLLLGLTIEREVDGRSQRIAIVGDADFGASRFLGNGANASFAESLLLWLAGDDEALDFVVRAAPDSELVLTTRSIIVLGSVWLISVPLLLLMVALFVWLTGRREDRQDHAT